MRRIAAELNLACAKRKDSQGICFVGKVDLPVFLQQKLKNNEIRVEDLTDQELDDMIKLYKSQLQVA